MEFDEIQRRLALISVIWTPTRQYENRIVSVQGNSVTVRSSQDGSRDREIRFQEIVDGDTPWNSRIIRSFRQILGLPLLPYDPAHPPREER